MSTYCIGDVQGCYKELYQLLSKIHFNSYRDTLWFVGDLVNRGPNSLEVLRFVKRLPKKVVVLGNHDLHLLNCYNKIVDFEASHLEPILTAPDAAKLIDWLRCQPLMHYDSELGYVMAHAGIYPQWDLMNAIGYAHEVELVLRGPNYSDFLQHMYGNQPDIWSEELTGWDRLRFIINTFTRMRFCSPDGKLEFQHTGKSDAGPQGYMPWFEVPQRKLQQQKIVFGHWAALDGKVTVNNVFAVDTGCVWGGNLTAMRLEDGKLFQCSCQ